MPLWVAVLLLAHLHSHPAQKQASSKFVSAISAHVMCPQQAASVSETLGRVGHVSKRTQLGLAWQSVLPSHLNDFLHAKEPLTKPA